MSRKSVARRQGVDGPFPSDVPVDVLRHILSFGTLCHSSVLMAVSLSRDLYRNFQDGVIPILLPTVLRLRHSLPPLECAWSGNSGTYVQIQVRQPTERERQAEADTVGSRAHTTHLYILMAWTSHIGPLPAVVMPCTDRHTKEFALSSDASLFAVASSDSTASAGSSLSLQVFDLRFPLLQTDPDAQGLRREQRYLCRLDYFAGNPSCRILRVWFLSPGSNRMLLLIIRDVNEYDDPLNLGHRQQRVLALVDFSRDRVLATCWGNQCMMPSGPHTALVHTDRYVVWKEGRMGFYQVWNFRDDYPADVTVHENPINIMDMGEFGWKHYAPSMAVHPLIPQLLAAYYAPQSSDYPPTSSNRGRVELLWLVRDSQGIVNNIRRTGVVLFTSTVPFQTGPLKQEVQWMGSGAFLYFTVAVTSQIIPARLEYTGREDGQGGGYTLTSLQDDLDRNPVLPCDELRLLAKAQAMMAKNPGEFKRLMVCPNNRTAVLVRTNGPVCIVGT